MLNNKLDLRVNIIACLFNSIQFLDKSLLEDYFSNNAKKKREALNKIYILLNNRTFISNYDEVNLLLSKFNNINYYEGCNEECISKDEYYLFKLLNDISKIFISHRNGKIILKYWSSYTENNHSSMNKSKKAEENIQDLGVYTDLNKIAFWNSLSREINVDVLVFQYLINNKMDDDEYLKYYHSIVHIDDLSLEKVLNKGVAETHLHISAGINFEHRWIRYMNYERNDIVLNNIELVSHGEFTSESVLKFINIAVIIRAILARYITDNPTETLSAYYGLGFGNKEECGNKYIKNFFENITGNNLSSYTLDVLNEIKEHLNLESQHYDRYEDSELNNNLNFIINKDDFLSSFFNYDVEYSLEKLLIFRCFKYIKRSKENDCLFVKTFYKYLHIKNSFYKLSMQDNKIKGLDRFLDSFKIATKYEGDANEKLMLSLNSQLQNTNLKKLEFRISFTEGNVGKIKSNMIKELKVFFEFYKNILKNRKNNSEAPVEIGIIYHLIKEKDDNNKCWQEFLEYDNESSKLYYQRLRNKYIMQVQAMNELREDIDNLSKYIVGLDAASIENYTDPWVFAPIFDSARDSERRMLGKKGHVINNLGFTFHVGEDFRHILSGVRKIYEVIKYFKFHSGDRIGHGIALGVDIERWIEANRVVILPRGEYLENLLWIWDMITKEECNYEFDINYIEREIINVASKIYGYNSSLNVYQLYNAYKEKFFYVDATINYLECHKCTNCIHMNEYENNKRKFNNCIIQEGDSWSVEKLVYASHCKIYLERIEEPIEIEVKREELYLINCMQELVRKIVAREGIVIETNPTSNRVIGQIDNIFNHYIGKINDLDLTKDDNIVVSINTDDPSVFNTNINNEYAYIFYSMLDKGYDRTKCLQWIDRIRENALNSSFIPYRYIDFEILEKEIDEIIRQLGEELWI